MWRVIAIIGLWLLFYLDDVAIWFEHFFDYPSEEGLDDETKEEMV